MDKTILLSLPVEELQTIIIDSVNSCLEHYKKTSSNEVPNQEILNVKQASELLGLAIPTIYAMTSNRTLPHSKRGKKLYFQKSELLDWIRSGKKKTKHELTH